MSAFYKFQEPTIREKETLADYKIRILQEHKNVTILTDNELKGLSRSDIVELHSINYSRYIEIFGKWEDEYKTLKIGDEITVAIFDIEPRDMCNKCWGPSEWDLANAGESYSAGLIEVDRKLTVLDGHNRLKQAIASGKDFIKVKVVR